MTYDSQFLLTEMMIEEFFDDSSSSLSSESDSEVMDTRNNEIVLMVTQWIVANKMKRKHAGSQMGRLAFQRNRVVDHDTIMVDYFVPGCTYPGYMFWRRFHRSE